MSFDIDEFRRNQRKVDEMLKLNNEFVSASLGLATGETTEVDIETIKLKQEVFPNFKSGETTARETMKTLISRQDWAEENGKTEVAEACKRLRGEIRERAADEMYADK